MRPSLTSVAPTNEFAENDHRSHRRRQGRCESPGIKHPPAGPTGSDERSARLLYPAIRREPRRLVIDSRRPRGPAGAVAVTSPRRFHERHRSARLHVRRGQAAAGGRRLATTEHYRRGRCRSRRPTSSPSPGSTSRTSPARPRRRKAALAIRQLMRSPDVIGHIEIPDLADTAGAADQVNADAIAAGEPNPEYEAGADSGHRAGQR